MAFGAWDWLQSNASNLPHLEQYFEWIYIDMLFTVSSVFFPFFYDSVFKCVYDEFNFFPHATKKIGISLYQGMW